ncbi:MAG: YeiH family protein [Intrasporangium sp.]|uniref:YeiH family protein n=1 Tax=Intrasporangium sp. TaxID=1925024 RepID=UPI0026477D80|nr:YeiH family protein [Intrasporangium sp.]MDN5796295.1 YeiH family protein [Intrasporangium sp.]
MPTVDAGKLARLAPGLAIVLVIAVVATFLGSLAPIVGAPVAGVVIGGLVTQVSHVPAPLAAGIRFCAKTVLQLAVVVLGFRLSLAQIAQVGADSMPTMLGTLAVCLLAAYYAGRLLGIDGDLRALIGVGTGICGASAIAAVAPVIRARNEDIAYAISTIFLFNIAAVLLFPPVGHLLGMSQDAFGLFAGTAVNDTSSVVAAATIYGDEAGDHAVVVKLTRTLMIIPISVALSAIVARRERSDRPGALFSKVSKKRLVPWFLVGFLIAATVNSLGLVPAGWQDPLQFAAVFLITMALTAIGLTTDLTALRRAGFRPLLLGGILWVVVSVSSLVIQYATSS